MGLTCPHCGTDNEGGKFCTGCGKPLPVVCPKCGATSDPGDKFCSGCGSALPDSMGSPVPPRVAPPAGPAVHLPQYPPQPVQYPPQPVQYPPQPVQYPPQPVQYPPQPVQYPPQPPQYYPQAAAYMPQVPIQPKPRNRWLKWLGSVLGVLVILVSGLRLLDTLGLLGGGGPTVKLAARGSLGARPDVYDSSGPFLVAGKGSKVTFYSFDKQGKTQVLNAVNETSSGKLLDVTVGDIFNSGVLYAVATYERRLYVVPQSGQPSKFDVAAKKVLIGDFDGDGKNETIFISKGKDGKDEYDVWRYAENQSNAKQLITLGGRTAPEITSARVTVDKKSLLLGYVHEDGLKLVLYAWDSVAGPKVYGKYPIQDTTEAPAFSISSGGLAIGPVLLVSRGGQTPTMEFFSVSKDGAKSAGTAKLDGKGDHSVTIGQFLEGDPQILTIDEKGDYFIYHVAK